MAKSGGLWRDGKLLAVHRNLRALPDRCIKTCKTTALERVQWTFSKTPGGIAGAVGAALVLGQVAPAALAAGAEYMPLSIPLHKSFLAAERRRNMISGAIVLIGILVTIAAMPILLKLQTSMPEAAMRIGGLVGAVGIGIVAVGGVISLGRTNILTLVRITEEVAWFKGASPVYLATLPALPPPHAMYK